MEQSSVVSFVSLSCSLQFCSLGSKLETGEDGWRGYLTCTLQPCGIYLEITVSFMTVLPIQTSFTTGTRKRIKLSFHKDLLEKWIYSFIMKDDVHVVDDCIMDMKRNVVQKWSLNTHLHPLVTHLWEMKLLNWILWIEQAIPWLYLFLPLSTVQLLKSTALAEQKLDLLHILCSCNEEF